MSSDRYITVSWTNLMTPSAGLMSGQNVRIIYQNTCRHVPESVHCNENLMFQCIKCALVRFNMGTVFCVV